MRPRIRSFPAFRSATSRSVRSAQFRDRSLAFEDLEVRAMLTGVNFARQMTKAGQVSILKSEISAQTSTPSEQLLFLTTKYTNLVQQPPSAAVIRHMKAALGRGQSESQILGSLMGSRHAVESMTRAIYANLLQRAPSRWETARAILATNGTGDPRRILLQVVSSPEYFHKEGGSTNAGYVQAIYRDVFRYDAGPDIVASYTSSLAIGTSRRALAARLIHSPAFTSQLTRSHYGTLLGQEPTSSQLDTAANMLQRPRGYGRLVSNIMTQPVMEQPAGPASPPQQSADEPVFIVGPEIPSFSHNSGLSIKRVDGSLDGWAQNHLAAPFVVSNASNRTIGGTNVDWWGITLNTGDTVTLTIIPTGTTKTTNFAVRIWDPKNDLVATREGAELVVKSDNGSSSQISYRAPVGGTYTIGISFAGYTQYLFDPNANQAAPSGTPVNTYTAEFYTTPGTNTDLIKILQTYSNPANTQNGWPTWSEGMENAYANLKQVAGWLDLAGDPDLNNFSDFRQIKDITDADTLAKWLNAAWSPFEYLLEHSQDSSKINDAYNYMFLGLTPQGSLQEWSNIANSFLTNENDYGQVFEQLLLANNARQNIQNFLQDFVTWSKFNEDALFGKASGVATLLQEGNPIPQPPPVPQPVGMSSFWKGVLDVFENVAIEAVGVITDGIGSLVATGALTATTDVIENSASGTGGSGNPYLSTQTKTDNDLVSTAQEIDSNMVAAFEQSLLPLMSEEFLTNVFSNFGVLKAFLGIQLLIDTDSAVSKTNALAKSYEISAWKQLLPRAFKWQEVGFQTSSTMPNYANFVASNIDYSYTSLDSYIFSKGYDEFDNLSQTFQSMQSSRSMAAQQALAMQQGQSYNYQGYTPNISPDDDNDDYYIVNYQTNEKIYYYPGPISIPSTVTGNANRFYAVADAVLTQNIHTQTAQVQMGENQWSYFRTNGAYVQEWALISLDGNYEISKDAATTLFGTFADASFSLTQGPGLDSVTQVVIDSGGQAPVPNSIRIVPIGQLSWDSFNYNEVQVEVLDGDGNILYRSLIDQIPGFNSTQFQDSLPQIMEYVLNAYILPTTLTGADNSILIALKAALAPAFGAYWDTPVAPDGLATRYDVFTNWGTDVSGFGSPTFFANANHQGTEAIFTTFVSWWGAYDVQYSLNGLG